jgi:hypothetical protein
MKSFLDFTGAILYSVVMVIVFPLLVWLKVIIGLITTYRYIYYNSKKGQQVIRLWCRELAGHVLKYTLSIRKIRLIRSRVANL